MRKTLDSQSLRVSGDVPGHAAESLAVTVHRGPGAGALGRARLSVGSSEQNQDQDGDRQQQQPPRSLQGAAKASGAESAHHHCGKLRGQYETRKMQGKYKNVEGKKIRIK